MNKNYFILPIALFSQMPLALGLAAFLPTATEAITQIPPIESRGIAIAVRIKKLILELVSLKKPNEEISIGYIIKLLRVSISKSPKHKKTYTSKQNEPPNEHISAVEISFFHKHGK